MHCSISVQNMSTRYKLSRNNKAQSHCKIENCMLMILTPHCKGLLVSGLLMQWVVVYEKYFNGTYAVLVLAVRPVTFRTFRGTRAPLL